MVQRAIVDRTWRRTIPGAAMFSHQAALERESHREPLDSDRWLPGSWYEP